MEENLHSQAPLFVINALDLDEQVIFEEHLETCPDCQQEVRELSESAALMAESLAVEPPNMRGKIMSRISAEQGLEPVSAPKVSDTSNSLIKRAMTLAALPLAALLLLSIGWAISRNSNPSEPAETDLVLAAGDASVSNLEGSDGTVSVTWSKSLGKAVIVSASVPDIPGELVHQLWLIDTEGNPKSVGIVELGATEQAVSVVEVNQSAGAVWGITVEPAGGSSLPTGDIIYSGDV